MENTADEAVGLILVTSAYHMYRAKRFFEKQGFIVIPYKVDYKSSGNQSINVLDFLPSSDNLKTTETGIRKIFVRLSVKN